jgi:hypothetical protein
MDEDNVYGRDFNRWGAPMDKKASLITVCILVSAALVAALLLGLNSACVKADPGPPLHTELRGEGAQRRTARAVIIVQPTAGDILTTTQQPTYTVQVEIDGLVALEVVSISVDGGATYHEAKFDPLQIAYAYDWGLPDEDYEGHLLVARAGYSAGEPRVVSDTATVYVDTLPPQGTVITVPSLIETTGFTVSWSASDGSGVITYDVEYQRDDEITWSSWASDSSETSKVFAGPLEGGHSYTFRMRAHDKGNNVSNWVHGSVQVGRSYVYLPLTLRQWVWWYEHDRYEPNDTPSQAWGPLEPERVYEAYIWNETDQDDYYHFTPATAAGVQVTLTNIPGDRDYDLYVYYYDPVDGRYVQQGGSNEPGSSDERVAFTPVPSRPYYVRVYPYVGFSSQQPYRLRLMYGVDD